MGTAIKKSPVLTTATQSKTAKYNPILSVLAFKGAGNRSLYESYHHSTPPAHFIPPMTGPSGIPTISASALIQQFPAKKGA